MSRCLQSPVDGTSHRLTAVNELSLDRDSDCGICLEPISTTAIAIQHTAADDSVLPCRNSWHFECLNDWIHSSDVASCPVCRCHCVTKFDELFTHHVVDCRRGLLAAIDPNGSMQPTQLDTAFYQTCQHMVGVWMETPVLLERCRLFDLSHQAAMWFWSSIVGCTLYRTFRFEANSSSQYYVPYVPLVELFPSMDALRSQIGSESYELLLEGYYGNLQLPVTISVISRILEAFEMSNRELYDQVVQDLDDKTLHLISTQKYWGLFSMQVGVTQRLLCVPWPDSDLERCDIGPKTFPGLKKSHCFTPLSDLSQEAETVAMADLLAIIKADTKDLKDHGSHDVALEELDFLGQFISGNEASGWEMWASLEPEAMNRLFSDPDSSAESG